MLRLYLYKNALDDWLTELLPVFLFNIPHPKLFWNVAHTLELAWTKTPGAMGRVHGVIC